MASLTENENWICANCEEEMSGPECALCGEPKEGSKPNIEKIIQILKGLNMKTIFETHVELQEFIDEVELVYKDEKPTSFFEPRFDLDEESVLDYAETLLKSFDDFFQTKIPEYIKLDNKSKELLYELNNNRKKEKALTDRILLVKKELEEEIVQAVANATLTDEYKSGDIEKRKVLIDIVRNKWKQIWEKRIGSYENDLIKLKEIMGSLQDKWKASLTEIQKIRKESLRELFEHMKETTGTELSEKELSVIYNTAIEILGTELVKPPLIPGRPKSQMNDNTRKRLERTRFLKLESHTWLETLSGFVAYLKNKEEEDTDSWFKTIEEEEEEAQKKGDELVEEQRKEEEKKRRRREKKKRQKTRKKLEKQKKAAEMEALRLREQELEAAEIASTTSASTVSWPEQQDPVRSAIPAPNPDAKPDPMSDLDRTIIGRVLELYLYLQKKKIFASERAKREMKMAIVQPHQQEIIRYIKTYLIPELKKHGMSLVLTGGFATRLLSRNHYNTEDIDMKVCSAEMSIHQMRKIVKKVLEESRGESLEEMFEIFDPIDKVWRKDAGKANEMINDGNVALKITIPTGRKISVGGRQIDEREPLAELTFVNGSCNVSTTINGIPTYSAKELVDNLLDASNYFEERIKIATEKRARGEPTESIYDEKVLSWFWQLQELLRLTTRSDAVEIMQKDIERIKSPSPKEGGKRKTRKRRKRKTRRKKNRKKRTRRK